MIKQTILATLSPLRFLSAHEPGGFRIKGKISGQVEGKKVYLKYADIPSKTILDSAVIHNGEFAFSGTAATPRFYSLVIKNDEPTDGARARPRDFNLSRRNNDNISVAAVYGQPEKGEVDFCSGGGTSRGNGISGSAGNDLSCTSITAQEIRFDRRNRPVFDWLHRLPEIPGKVMKSAAAGRAGMNLCRKMDVADKKRKAFMAKILY